MGVLRTLSVGLEISKAYAKENWDKLSIYAYDMGSTSEWVITDINELDNLNDDVIIFIDNG